MQGCGPPGIEFDTPALKELNWAELKSLESNLNIIPSRGYGQVPGYYIPSSGLSPRMI